MLENLYEVVKMTLGRDDKPWKESEVRLMNPLVLAYMGDAIYDLYIRTYLINRFDVSVHRLHVMATRFVKARAQYLTIQRIIVQLSEDEFIIFKRGRNAKSGTVPKNADVIEYRYATGFESLLGYLYLCGKDSRLTIILQMAVCNADEILNEIK